MIYKVYDWEGILQGQYESISMAALSVLIKTNNEDSIYSVADLEGVELIEQRHFCGTLIKMNPFIVVYTDITGYVQVFERISANSHNNTFQFKTHKTEIQRA